MYEALSDSREVGEVVLGGVANECHNDGLERVRVRLFKVEQHLHTSAYVSIRQKTLFKLCSWKTARADTSAVSRVCVRVCVCVCVCVCVECWTRARAEASAVSTSTVYPRIYRDKCERMRP